MKKHVQVIKASSRYFMIQGPGLLTTFFSLPLHHLLFPHLFLQPPHFPCSLLHLSLIPTGCHPPPPPPPPACLALHHSTCIQHRSQGARASSHLYIHAVRTLCCTTLRCFFPYCYDQILITWTRAVKKTSPRLTFFPLYPSVFLSFSISLW